MVDLGLGLCCLSVVCFFGYFWVGLCVLLLVGFCVQLSVSGIVVDSILGLRVLCMGFVKVSEKFSGDFKRVKNKGDGAIRNHKLTERK